MAKQSFLWTTLPNGFTADHKSLRVSVLLSPRLDPEADPQRLDSFFPDWEDWPSTLAQSTFHVTFGFTKVSIPATETSAPNRVDTTLGTADSVLWKALFKPELFVRPFAFQDFSDNRVLSFDTVGIEAKIRDLYAKVAAATSGQMPTVSDFLDDPDWQDLIQAVSELDRRYYDEKTRLRNPARHFEDFLETGLHQRSATAEIFSKLQLFHTPATPAQEKIHTRTDDPRIEARWLEHQRPALPDKADLAKEIDFHQVVAAMNQYPTLLRRFGFVVDLVLEATQFPVVPDAPLSTEVEHPPGSLQIPATPSVSPVTHAGLSDQHFQPVSNPTLASSEFQVKEGLLALPPLKFRLLQTDVDGAGLKLMNFARSLARKAPGNERVDSVTRFEKEAGTPSLRTAGLMLVHRQRGSTLEHRFQTNLSKNLTTEMIFQGQSNASPPELWAEDLVRGFRFDVWDADTGVWRSLCQRTATYDVDGTQVVVTPENPEEGTVRMAATKSPDPASNPKVTYLHEAVVSWTGWSLAAPPPGRAILPDDQVDKNTTETEPELPPGMSFKTNFKALPSSLPRLRFGRRYRMRGRVVDLAGNSLPPRESDYGPEPPVSEAQPFLRYEPITAPVIALVRPENGTTEKPKEGESMERIAIRSFNDTPADNTVPTTQSSRRFAVPPQASARDAEYHGMLDAGGRVDPTTFNLLANQKDFDATDPAAALQEEKIPTQGPLDPSPIDTVYAVYLDGRSLTYLPDPLAREVAVRFFGHPEISENEILTIPLYPGSSWPEAQPFKIQVHEDPGAKPNFEETTRTLRIPIPKAIKAKVRLSMKPSEEALKSRLGIWQWLSQPDQEAKLKLTLNGQHWMLTPWRTLEIVHAVQRPLISPEFVKHVINRGYRSTSAQPRFLATCSLKSTDRLDLLAEWHEPVDDPDDPESVAKPADRNRGDTAFSVKITDPSSYSMKHQGNPRGGFAEHTIPAEDVIGVGMPGDDRVTPKVHEFHDTRYRRIEYWLDATSRFREFLPPSLLFDSDPQNPSPTDQHIKVTGPRLVTWVPNSAPPPAPKVLYVVPTFNWVRTSNEQGNRTSWRRGGGLRVYLDRPWMASGYGEMLAVVLPPASFAGDPENEPKGSPLKNFVTQWANDPIWLSPFVSGIAPSRSAFPLARTAPDPSGSWLPTHAPQTESDQPSGAFQVTGLRPPGVPYSGSTVELAPHDVHYDDERQLWYCDIEINQGASYWPFIRLALARYQPVSISGAHLSEVVLADFMQLTADRWLHVNRTDQPGKRKVVVYGMTYSDSAGHREASHAPSFSVVNPFTGVVETRTPAEVAQKSSVEIWVERLNEARGEDFGWERVAGATATPSSPDLFKIPFRASPKVTRALELQSARKFTAIAQEGLIDQIYVVKPLWDGTVQFSGGPGGQRHRLVIAEYEEHLVDDRHPYDPVPEQKGRRLVFVEHVELD